MDEYLNNRQNEILWNLLTNPVNNGHTYVSNLQDLVTDFPQSGILHALLSHADGGQNRSHAAAYLNPRALYVIVNAPENLPILTDSQIIQHLDDTTKYAGAVHADDLNHWQPEPYLNVPPQTAEQELFTVAETERQDVFDEIGYSPLIARGDTGQHLSEESAEVTAAGPDLSEEPRYEQAVDAEHEPQVEAAESPDSRMEGPGARSEENIEPESLSQPLNGAELLAEALSREPLQDEFKALQEAGTMPHEPEQEETPAAQMQSEIEPAGSIREDELLTETPSFELAEAPRGIEDDVYDEIVGIEDISFAAVAQPSDEPVLQQQTAAEAEQSAETTDHSPAAEPFVQRERALNMDDETEKLIVGNIAATDYFVFDRAFNERKAVEPAENGSHVSVQTSSAQPAEEAIKPAEEAIKPADESQEVSKYDDDTLPYTFLWWLNKTRVEHAGIYQPFKLDTSQAIRRAASDELQQQYYENIFHLSSVDELDRSTSRQPIAFDPQRKEDRIIKRFIIEEPHITPPSSDKLDTENKARKSAEDQDEFVTETLARIYIDQMLYHKAISTYKKLMLKFPEKSRYFADQIEQLESKTN